jgi:teichuronic acid biosynthesis glycosyltransferase TuaG
MSASAPLVSIVVPCYNAEAFIGATLESVLAQTFSDWECVVIDDASSDGSAAVIARYAGADSRIRPVFQAVNGGAAKARNAGLAAVHGTYLAFLDADDSWLPEKLAKQVAFIRETGAALTHTSYRFVDEEGAVLPGGVNASDRVDLRSYMHNTEIGMSTSLLDRAQVGEFSFRDIRLCQDTHLWLVLLRRGLVSRGLPEPLVHYRVRRGQISGSKVAMAKQVYALYREIEEVGVVEQLVSYASYACNGLRKRLGTPG